MCTSIHLGCDVLERRIVLTASPEADFVFLQGTIKGYRVDAIDGDVEILSTNCGAPVAIIGEDAFNGNTTIKSLVIPDSFTLVRDRAFKGMTKLESAKSDNRVTYNSGIASHDDTTLATVSLGSRITKIGDGAFTRATLQAVTIPGTVTSIGDYAFYNNASLKSVTFLGNAPRQDNVGYEPFGAVAAGAKAVLAAALTGHGLNGGIWNGLIVTPPGRIAAPTVTTNIGRSSGALKQVVTVFAVQ